VSRAPLVLLCLALGACQATELDRKELMIQTALDAAYLACSTALNDPRMTWGPGARDYCLRVVNATPECVLP
jgi:hypothetical protein